MAATDTYVRNATVIRVIDGDTVEVLIDLGYRMSFRAICRLWGINAPEMQGVSRPEGIKAKEHLTALLAERRGVVAIRTHKAPDHYGRWVVELLSANGGPTVNETMVLDGFAVHYMRDR